jgi:hypothetical protein
MALDIDRHNVLPAVIVQEIFLGVGAVMGVVLATAFCRAWSETIIGVPPVTHLTLHSHLSHPDSRHI